MFKHLRAVLALALALAPAAAVAAPLPYGMNLTGVAYYQKEYPFLDFWKTRSTASVPPYTATGEPLGADPKAFPQWVLGTLDGRHDYDVITSGDVRWMSFNSQSATLAKPGNVTTKFTIDRQGTSSFKLHTSGATKIAIVESQYRSLYDAGEIFRPAFVETLRGFEVLRFMDWNDTNGRFADKPRALMTDPVWAPAVPIEAQAILSSKVGADMWLPLPAGSGNGHVVAAVKAANSNLAPDLKILLEYSNEDWNQGFAQARWLSALAAQVKMPSAQMYGLLSGNMAKAAATVAGPDRIKTMLCWQGSSMAKNADVIMKGWDMSGAPRSLIEGFCVATYPDVQSADAAQWTAWAKANDVKSAVAYLSVRQGVRAAYYPAIAAKAKAYGVSWSLYEYNSTYLTTNAPSPIAVADRPLVTTFNQAVAHSPDAVAILQANRAAFDAAGGKHYVLFNDVGAGGQYGTPGTMGPSSLDLSYPATSIIRPANDNAWKAMKADAAAGYLGVKR